MPSPARARPVIGVLDSEALAAHKAGRLAFAFSAGGFLFSYHISVVATLRRYGLIAASTPLAGVSAGSLVAALVKCDVPTPDIQRMYFECVADLRRNGTAGRIREVLHAAMERHLPPNAHQLCSGGLYVGVSELLPYPRHVQISDFPTRQSLIDALLTSCHLPRYSSPAWTIQRNGRPTVDGGFTAIVPSLPPELGLHTVKVCCLPASRVEQLPFLNKKEAMHNVAIIPDWRTATGWAQGPPSNNAPNPNPTSPMRAAFSNSAAGQALRRAAAAVPSLLGRAPEVPPSDMSAGPASAGALSSRDASVPATPPLGKPWDALHRGGSAGSASSAPPMTRSSTSLSSQRSVSAHQDDSSIGSSTGSPGKRRGSARVSPGAAREGPHEGVRKAHQLPHGSPPRYLSSLSAPPRPPSQTEDTEVLPAATPAPRTLHEQAGRGAGHATGQATARAGGSQAELTGNHDAGEAAADSAGVVALLGPGCVDSGEPAAPPPVSGPMQEGLGGAGTRAADWWPGAAAQGSGSLLSDVAADAVAAASDADTALGSEAWDSAEAVGAPWGGEQHSSDELRGSDSSDEYHSPAAAWQEDWQEPGDFLGVTTPSTRHLELYAAADAVAAAGADFLDVPVPGTGLELSLSRVSVGEYMSAEANAFMDGHATQLHLAADGPQDWIADPPADQALEAPSPSASPSTGPSQDADAAHATQGREHGPGLQSLTVAEEMQMLRDMVKWINRPAPTDADYLGVMTKATLDTEAWLQSSGLAAAVASQRRDDIHSMLL